MSKKLVSYIAEPGFWLPFLFFSIFFQQFAHCRNNIHVFMRQHGQLSGQNLNFFMYRLLFVHNKQFLALNGAKTTSDLNPRNLEILLGNRYLHSLGQVYELLIQLVGFHDIKVL